MDLVCFYGCGDHTGLGHTVIDLPAAGFRVAQASCRHAFSCSVCLGMVANGALGTGTVEASALEHEC